MGSLCWEEGEGEFDLIYRESGEEEEEEGGGDVGGDKITWWYNVGDGNDQ